MIKLNETSASVNVLAEGELTQVVGGCGYRRSYRRRHHGGWGWRRRYGFGHEGSFEGQGSEGPDFSDDGFESAPEASGDSPDPGTGEGETVAARLF